MLRRRLTGHAVSIAMHAAVLMLIAALPAHRRSIAASGPRQVVVAMMAPRPTPQPAQDAVITPPREERPGVEGDPTLYVGGFTFDVDTIARRRDLLFPFITGDVAFEQMTARLEQPDRAVELDGADSAAARPQPALHLSNAALQAIVDRAWSRRDRWSSFAEIRDLLVRYDGTTGDAPRVLRRYLDQNILQPYYDASIPDPRLWVMLGLSVDHIDFIDFVATYLHDHRGTRAATDLLFLLDKLVQGNRDALLVLLRADPAQLDFTRRARGDAFDLLLGIQRHYRSALATRGLTTEASIAARYDTVRLRLLAAIVDTTPDGYRANDARYLAGALHWRDGEVDAALRVWRTIRPSADDSFFLAYSRVLAAIARRADGRLDVDSRAIAAALDAEDGRWLVASFDRLRQFGYRFDTY
jgi:hypothetical protein